MAEKHISTTALARLLGKESKELFILLTGGGWILKVDNHWQLTEKGKFEGGIYVTHPKYGEYIAWPETVSGHPLLKLLPEAPLSASQLGAKWGLPARLVNLLLAERKFVKKHIRGWLLAPEGKLLGGQQHYAEASGIPFVTWPENIVDEPQLLISLQQLQGDIGLKGHPTLDGHSVNNEVQRRLDNWLYITGRVHARDYVLNFETTSVKADYYLPEVQLCVEVWADELGQDGDHAGVLAAELEKHQLYKKHGVKFIELRNESIHEIDEIMARELLRCGLAVY
jgi:hypothetical protein